MKRYLSTRKTFHIPLLVILALTLVYILAGKKSRGQLASQRLSSPPPFTHRFGQVDIIFNYCSEPVEKVTEFLDRLRSVSVFKDYKLHVTAYIKCDPPVPDDQFVTQTRVDAAIRLENRAREASTYLRHIIKHYNQLPPWTIFMQALPHHPDLFLLLLEKQFNSRLGMMSLEWLYSCECGHDCDGTGDFTQVRDIHALVKGKICLESYAVLVLIFSFVDGICSTVYCQCTEDPCKSSEIIQVPPQYSRGTLFWKTRSPSARPTLCTTRVGENTSELAQHDQQSHLWTCHGTLLDNYFWLRWCEKDWCL